MTSIGRMKSHDLNRTANSPCPQLRTLVWHLVATVSHQERNAVSPPAIFGIESAGCPSDTTGTMTHTDSQVTGKLQSYGGQVTGKLQSYGGSKAKSKTPINSMICSCETELNTLRNTITLQRQSQLWEHFKQPEMTQPELWKQS